MNTRKIIHIDMDAFYASVEQRDHPELKGKPVIVGGSPLGRGVVAAASYEARKYGIRSAMPAAHARKLCPKAVFIRPRFEVYKEISLQIRAIFSSYTDMVEPLSLDEAYLDVTQNKTNTPSATLIARDIKQRIRDQTQLTASAGISFNKFLAKIASDLRKPDGLVLISPEKALDFIAKLPVGTFHGVGVATEAKMHRLGIRTGADLRRWSEPALIGHFGKTGSFYYKIARGEDHRPVRNQRVPKSIGKETTFAEDVESVEVLAGHVRSLAQQVADRMLQKKGRARTVILKIRYHDFESITRSITPGHHITGPERISYYAVQLLQDTEAGRRKVRLAGVTVSGLDFEDEINKESKPGSTQTSQLSLPLDL